MVGRQSGEARLEVLRSAAATELEELVHGHTAAGCVLYTDEWAGYDGVDRPRQSCRHTPGSREWARDDDGDGVREVHNNTLEGMWTGLRNFLRTFRGVSKHFLAQYVAIFQWSYNVKSVVDDFLRTLLGIPFSTIPAS